MEGSEDKTDPPQELGGEREGRAAETGWKEQ